MLSCQGVPVWRPTSHDEPGVSIGPEHRLPARPEHHPFPVAAANAHRPLRRPPPPGDVPLPALHDHALETAEHEEAPARRAVDEQAAVQPARGPTGCVRLAVRKPPSAVSVLPVAEHGAELGPGQDGVD